MASRVEQQRDERHKHTHDKRTSYRLGVGPLSLHHSMSAFIYFEREIVSNEQLYKICMCRTKQNDNNKKDDEFPVIYFNRKL